MIAGHVVERVDASTSDHLRKQRRRVGANGAGSLERGAVSPNGIDARVGDADRIPTLDDRKALVAADESAEHRVAQTNDHRSASVRRDAIRRVTEPIGGGLRRVDDTEDPAHPFTVRLLGRLRQQATLSHLGHESGRV